MVILCSEEVVGMLLQPGMSLAGGDGAVWFPESLLDDGCEGWGTDCPLHPRKGKCWAQLKGLMEQFPEEAQYKVISSFLGMPSQSLTGEGFM